MRTSFVFVKSWLIGALVAVAPVLVSSEALAVIEPEPCGEVEIPGDAGCEIVTGGDCSSMCDACDHAEQCGESCAEECCDEADEIGCVASCISQCALELATSCGGGCSGDGSLFCDGMFIDVPDLDVCADYLCSIGMDLGESCGEAEDDAGADPSSPAEPADAKPAKPVCASEPCPPVDQAKPAPEAVAGYGEPYNASRPDLPACAASPGSIDTSKGALVAALVGVGLFVARRRRR